MRAKIAAAVVMLMVGMGAVRGESIEQTEAKKRGVAVEMVQLEAAKERIAFLEQENAKLKKSAQEFVDATDKMVGSLKEQIAELKRGNTGAASNQDVSGGDVIGSKYAAYRNRTYQQKVQELKGQIKTKAAERDERGVSEFTKQLNMVVAQGPKKFIPTFFQAVRVGDGGLPALPMKIIQRIDTHSAIMQIGETVVKVQGIDFSTATDDTAVAITSPLLATKTVTYDTALGSTNTVILLESFDPANFEKY